MNDIKANQIGVVGDNAQIGSIIFQSNTSSIGKPFQRPPRVAHFTDRKKELNQLLSCLQPGEVVTLCGPGGIGKTALAIEAIWRLAGGDEPPEQFPDGIIFHSFYNQTKVASALEAIARTFGEEPKPTPRDAALRVLAGKRALLLLDGAEDADDLRVVLDVRGSCGVIVTSRTHKDALTVQQRQDIPRLEPDEALKLLQQHAGAPLDETIGREICRFVDGLPLAVRLVGQYLAITGEASADYLTWLRENPLLALNLPKAQHRDESIKFLLKKSMEQVSNKACEVLSVVGLLALYPFGRGVLAAALNMSENEMRQPLGELLSYGLLLGSADQYEVSHALILAYIRQQLPVDNMVVERLVNYYTTLVKELSALGVKGYRQLDTEREHLLRILSNCAEREKWQSVLNLMKATENYFRYQGYWLERRLAVNLGLNASRKLKDRAEEANCIKALGDVHISLAEYELARARYEEARPIYAQIGDRYSYAANLAYMGLAYSELGQNEKALKLMKEAVILFEEIKSPFAHLAKQWLSDLKKKRRTKKAEK